MTKQFVVLGAGAAGFFGAIACAEANPDAKVLLLEKTQKPLAKVRISGGGRCNVTHHCFDPLELVKSYPRGHKALRGPFSRFQPRDTVEWFAERGVKLKVEPDGRMFPTTNRSETVIRCLMDTAEQAGVELRVGVGIKKIERGFILHDGKGGEITCDALLVASGSSGPVYRLLAGLGHTIVPPLPSLFTFNVPSSPLLALSGISLEDVRVKIEGTSLEQRGPLLLTHWGFSGPAILKLSAWGARILHEKGYKADLQVDWIPGTKDPQALALLQKMKTEEGSRQIGSCNPFLLPRKLWHSLAPEGRWLDLSLKAMRTLVDKLKRDSYHIDGKTTFKEEFVTCGGVSLDEVNFKTMESKLCPGLFFAGEVLDIDGVTGGFNFQNAWTTSWIAGNSM